VSPSKSWRASGSPRASRTPGAGARPEGSLHVAMERARVIWDGLTGGPGPALVDHSLCDCGVLTRPFSVDGGDGLTIAGPEHLPGCAGIVSTGRYSEYAAATILDAGLRLWGDTAATMTEDPPAEG